MNDREKHVQEVLWKNARESKLARREIASKTERHKDTTAKGRLEKARRGR
jgi:hypothetical protein